MKKFERQNFFSLKSIKGDVSFCLNVTALGKLVVDM